MKRLLLFLALAAASCKPTHGRMGATAPIATPGQTITFDPTVSPGLTAAINTTVFDSGGTFLWTKYAVSNTAWRPVPMSTTVASDPSQAPGLKASVGFVVFLNDGSKSWVKSTSADTGWAVNPGGGGGGIAADGGVLAPLTGLGSVVSPLSIPAATPDAGGYMTAAQAATIASITSAGDIKSTISVATNQFDSGTLNGNLDGGYWINFTVTTNNGPNQNISLLVNNAATNLVATAWDVEVFGVSKRTDWLFSNTGAYGFAISTTLKCMGRLDARAGRPRHLDIRCRTDDTFQDILNIVGDWTDTTTNLTKFSILAANASGLAVGGILIMTPIGNNL